ncbi:MAG: Cell morphogenesis protein PAG1 [Trizodia sp. TS-e1964]|nr:MAG: Cell morphogenesis protein PAG1 [Trizodia sp. TS-e1964]
MAGSLSLQELQQLNSSILSSAADTMSRRQESFATGAARSPVPLPRSHSAAHSREPSSTTQGLVNAPLPPLPMSSPRVPAAGHSRGSQPNEAGLERKQSISYGHHRQASIVHGYQHSRNASFVNSPTIGPLSPQMIAAAGATNSPGFLTSKQEIPDISSTASTIGLANGGPSILSPNNNPDPAVSDSLGVTKGHKRPERNKSRREHNYHRSHSRHPQPDLKTVGDYAMHVLFNCFVRQAEDKIERCVISATDQDPHVEQICGPMVDPNFDQLITALAHIARQKPKPLIDLLMFWRKEKSELASSLRNELGKLKSAPPLNGLLPRRNTEPLHLLPDISNHNPKPSHSRSPTLTARQEALSLAERRSTVTIYLLCRVLIEIISQTSLASVTPDMAERLEDLMFNQLKAADLEQLYLSPLKMANWLLFSQVLGVMSGMNFETVTNRFFAELDKCQKEIGAKGFVNKETEGRIELVVTGMKHLQLKLYPESAWDQTCNFMASLAAFFSQSHGQRIKYAYCNVLVKHLIPIAATTNLDLNKPKWKETVETIGPRLSQMLNKPRHWPTAYPLTAVLYCVSPPEFFSAQWMQIVSLQAKIKDKNTRGIALQGICRLVWVYLFRNIDSTNATLKRLEEIIKFVLPPGKKSYISTEPHIAEPFIQLIRIIGFRHHDLCFRTIIFPLINSELFASGRELRVEQLEPEKMVIGIRSFLAIMADLEKGEKGRPPFPQTFALGSIQERLPNSPTSEPRPPVPGSKLREERLSRPVLTSGLGDIAKEYYSRFCEILGKITIMCDNTFGGQAALDEKFNAAAQTPKTPISDTFSFTRKEEHQVPPEQRQGFYDLLHVAVQALPRCLSAHIPFNSLVNLLCTGTAHVHSDIAQSSAQSLKSIARQFHSSQVTIGFARFIFNFDDRYSTMSDGGMLGHAHIENTLKLYVELLEIWIEEIKLKSKEASLGSSEDDTADRRGVGLDLSGVLAYVDEIESHGFFFLCSQSRRVRTFAITVLRIVTEFDTALDKDNARIIHILEGESLHVMDFNDEHLSVAERSRLQRGIRKGNAHNTLIELCGSDNSYDSTLWYKIFPNLVRICFERCPTAITLSREIICSRLLHMRKGIAVHAEAVKGSTPGSFEAMPPRNGVRPMATFPESLVEQWKLYLIVACTTLTNSGAQQLGQADPNQHLRKSSKSSQNPQDKITSAQSLFYLVIPFLSATSSVVREAVVLALGSINVSLYRTLLEALQRTVAICNEEARTRMSAHQRTGSSPKRSRRTDRIRTEVTHVYRLTSHFLKDRDVLDDQWILNNLLTYTKDLRMFLGDAEVQTDWDFQGLRRHYCGLMEELFEGINKTEDPSRWMPFEARKSSFALMEDWCGFSPNLDNLRAREASLKLFLLEHQREHGENQLILSTVEKEKKELRTAALSAMAALCGGPLSISRETGSNLQFDIRRMLSWIDTIFNTPSDRMHSIGRRALSKLIIYNKQHPYLLERSIEMCYLAETKALESYFEVVSQVVLENPDYPMAFWRIIGCGLFTLGNERSQLRTKAAHLLRTLEERQYKSSKIQDFDISISDKTTSIFKLAQFEISKRMSATHPELAFLIFSEFTIYFKSLQATNNQRSMVAAILPWIQTVELQLDPNGGPTASSYMLLINLFEVTIIASSGLHNEVQALWQALATGPHAGNVQLVLDFIMSLCLENREQQFVDYAKQIVVFLSSTPAGLKVVEFLLLQISPKNMVVEKREPVPAPPEAHSFPYLADLTIALRLGSKHAGYSLGSLSLILLVDLMVSPVQLAAESVPILLQSCLVLWDHYTPLVQDQAHEMLIHLIHELVISKIDDETTDPTKKDIEAFIDSIRKNDQKVLWGYDESNGRNDNGGNRLPPNMEHFSKEVLRIFTIAYPGIREQWGKSTLGWATSCPVRHIACRSFQIFRCILTALEQPMLADMLARLSNTIADDETDIQTFSMEILTTLKTLIGAMDPPDLMEYPQLFWTTAACLKTIHEREYMETLLMLEKLLDKLSLGDPKVVKSLVDNSPPKWEGIFEGLQTLVYKGLRSSVTMDQALILIEKLSLIPSNELVGDDSRLLFAVLVNIPRFLHSMELGEKESPAITCAENLALVAERQGCTLIFRILNDYACGNFRTGREFLDQSASAIRESFFPEWDFKSLVFLMGLLTNSLPWVRVNTLKFLCVLIPDINLKKPEISSHGPDLISPLLMLLYTEFCPQALEVLDYIMNITGRPMDDNYLQMSIPGPHSRAARKEFARTKTLFGFPEQSGWSIPEPSAHSQLTRTNVHSVFYMCVSSENVDATTSATPDVEFHVDDFQYFPDRTGTMMSEDGRADGNMGELIQKLDNLDNFFEESPSLSTPLQVAKWNGQVSWRDLDISDVDGYTEAETDTQAASFTENLNAGDTLLGRQAANNVAW